MSAVAEQGATPGSPKSSATPMPLNLEAESRLLGSRLFMQLLSPAWTKEGELILGMDISSLL